MPTTLKPPSRSTGVTVMSATALAQFVSLNLYHGFIYCKLMKKTCFTGADADCDTAFFNSNDNQVQRACQADNVNLLITFCGGGTTKFTEAEIGRAHV